MSSKDHDKIEITVTSDNSDVPLNDNNEVVVVSKKNAGGKEPARAAASKPVLETKDSKHMLQPPKEPDHLKPRYEILHVEEKHGSLHKAIPVMPLPVAVVCCILNIACPGLGTLISSFTVLCGSPSRITNKTHAFLLNILAAFLQMVTFIIIVGWIWSILWGMTFVQLRLSEDEPESPGIPYYVRRQSSVDYRTANE